MLLMMRDLAGDIALAVGNLIDDFGPAEPRLQPWFWVEAGEIEELIYRPEVPVVVRAAKETDQGGQVLRRFQLAGGLDGPTVVHVGLWRVPSRLELHRR